MRRRIEKSGDLNKQDEGGEIHGSGNLFTHSPQCLTTVLYWCYPFLSLCNANVIKFSKLKNMTYFSV
jgi:hypothetical protein